LNDAQPVVGCLFCLIFVAVSVGLPFWLRNKRRAEASAGVASFLSTQTTGARSFSGYSPGLNNSGTGTDAILVVAAEQVSITRTSITGAKTDQFAIRDILNVEERDIRLEGLAGHLADQTRKSLFAPPNRWPGMVIRTRRGDVNFAVKPKHRGVVREARLAIDDSLGRRR
jgi:hypothetical protein